MRSNKHEFERLKSDFGWQVQEHLECREGVWYSKNKPSGISFPTESYEECSAIEQDSFWFSHRNRVIGSTIDKLGLDSCLCDIGAGNGAVSAFLNNKSLNTVALEPSELGAKNCLKRGIEPVVGSFLTDLSLPSGSIELIGSFDVIEHLEDPSKLLNECRRVLRPGGIMLVTVPAFRWLWSQTDSYAGHFTRYDKKSLSNLFKQNGFTEKYSTYFFSPLVLPVWIMRVLHDTLHRKSDEAIMRRSTNHLVGLRSKTINNLLKGVLKIEEYFLSFFSIPFGTSLLAVFELE